ncbi:MAG TPA: endonuclease/exonuclease/phosphatase family protein [Myxococcota bacterium]|nr:endonuclease/exonuclease/phosphatase family protein [Myxococcota bacterium]
MKSVAVVIAVLSYNVHGLNRWLVNDDPEARMPQISARLDAWDVALIQESWEYWELLSAHASHPVQERGNGPHPPRFFQAGLGLFARPAFVALSRGSLGACSGWLGGANDCFADKGFLRVRLRLENGLAVDFWTLHLDAGSAESDRAARAVQLETLAGRVRSLSGDAAVVIGGDFNSKSDEPADRALLDRFETELGLYDTGAGPAPAGGFAREHIDYIFYRSSAAAALSVVAAGEAREFSDGPAPLSDHPAVFARLRVEPASAP